MHLLSPKHYKNLNHGQWNLCTISLLKLSLLILFGCVSKKMIIL